MVVIPVAFKMTLDWGIMGCYECSWRKDSRSFVRNDGGLGIHHREGLAIPFLKAKLSLLPRSAVSPKLP